MNFIKFIPMIFQLMQVIGPIREAIRSGTSVLDVLKTQGPELIDLVQSVGKDLFSNLPAADAVQAGALRIDPETVKRIQTSLNRLGAKLVVDGSYGALTKAVVTKFQFENGLEVDGWAGKLTSTALDAAVAKL